MFLNLKKLFYMHFCNDISLETPLSFNEVAIAAFELKIDILYLYTCMV